MKKKYSEMINELMLQKRHPDDISVSLNIPEHKFKKYAEKFNWVIEEIYKLHKDNGTKMFHLILGLQDFFDVVWLKEQVLSPALQKIVEDEMSTDYGMKKSKKTIKKAEENL